MSKNIFKQSFEITKSQERIRMSLNHYLFGTLAYLAPENQLANAVEKLYLKGYKYLLME